MKFEYERENVKIVRHRTIAKALESLYGEHPLDVVSGLMGEGFHPRQQYGDLLQRSLARVHEGDQTYRRTCALATLEQSWKPSELYATLQEHDYCPASTSESVSFLALLREEKVRVEALVHLGTFIVDEDYQERRLVTYEGGRAELLAVFPSTKIRQSHSLVVIRKEKPTAPKRSWFGRRK